MSELTITLRLPSIRCDFCGSIAHPYGIHTADCAEALAPTIGIHRIDGGGDIFPPVYGLIGFTQADLEARAHEDGWRRFMLYGKEMRVCPKCQKESSTSGLIPGLAIKLQTKGLALLLAMRLIRNATTIEAAKEIAAAAVLNGEAE